jgi:hypothetical protein
MIMMSGSSQSRRCRSVSRGAGGSTSVETFEDGDRGATATERRRGAHNDGGAVESGRPNGTLLNGRRSTCGVVTGCQTHSAASRSADRRSVSSRALGVSR